jgi:hypothetical protein
MLAVLTQPFQHGDLDLQMTAIKSQRYRALNISTSLLVSIQECQCSCPVRVDEVKVEVEANGLVEILNGPPELGCSLFQTPLAPGSQTRVEVLHSLGLGK